MVAGVLGALALAAGEPYPNGARPDGDGGASYVGPIEIARWVRDGSPDVRLIDLRSDSQFAAYHIPGAEQVSPEGLRRGQWRRDETIVIYTDEDARALEAARLLRARGVERARVLRGGVLAWIDSIAEPRLDTLPASATPAERAARREHLELSRYFGGTPVVVPAPGSPAPAGADPVSSRQSEAVAVGRILRRGC